MNKKRIDLSDIKENDLDKTSSFTDLMTRSERKKRKKEKEDLLNEFQNYNDDILDMVEEKKKSTKDLTIELEKAKEKYNKEETDNNIGKTQILELTRQMKFNLEETKSENIEKKRKGISILNIIGEINLICIGFYIYLLIFTNYQEKQETYLITGGIIVLLVFLFGVSIISNRRISKLFNILNILAIISFIGFNVYNILY